MSAAPGWKDGDIPTSDEWNSWWARKLDNNDSIVTSGPFLPLRGGALTGNVTSVTTTAGDQLNLTKNYSTAMTGSPHQQVNTANITVPCAQELWNNFDDVNYNVVGGVDNSSNTHVVARYTQVRKYTRSVNVPSMAFIASVVDFTNQPSSIAGPLTGYELDLECAGPDDQTAFGANGSRVGMTLNFYPARGYAGNDSVVNAAYAVWGDTSRVSFKRLFNASAAWSVAAIDLTQGVQMTGAAGIAMNAGMRVRFAPLRDIFWDTSLFAAAGGFHLTGKFQVDELLYSPAGITSGGPITFSGTVTHSAAYLNTFVGAAFTVQSNVNIGGIVNIGPQGNANYIQINGSAGAVTIALTGTGTPANLVLRALGTGGVNINSQNGSLLQIQDGGAGTAVNSFLMIARPTGTYGTISLIDPTQGIMIGGIATAKLGFNAATPIAKPTLTGAKGSNAALTSVIAALVNYGLVTDTTTA